MPKKNTFSLYLAKGVSEFDDLLTNAARDRLENESAKEWLRMDSEMAQSSTLFRVRENREARIIRTMEFDVRVGFMPLARR
jgi:hypothetical protein